MPVDILHRRFKKTLRGYNVFEVDEFLKEVSQTLEDLLQEQDVMRKKVRELEERLKGFTLKEVALQNSLILAEKTAEERLISAKKEADLVIEYAKFEAERIKENNLQERKEALKEINTLKQQKQSFLIEFEALLSSYLNVLKKTTNTTKS